MAEVTDEKVDSTSALNGPCMTHGRMDCLDCCPELVDEPYDPWSDEDAYIRACGEQP